MRTINVIGFFRTDTAEHAKYDKRMPGLYEVEWDGHGVISLCSKTYYCFGDGKDKFSCTGVNKKNNVIETNLFDRFLPKKNQNLPYAAYHNSCKFGCNLSIFVLAVVCVVSSDFPLRSSTCANLARADDLAIALG